MKVLMTADTVGGVWTYALDLARALERHDVHFYLATKGAPLTREQRLDASAIPNLEVFESHFRLEWMQDPWDDVARASQWLLELEAKLSPDLVHLNDYAHGALPFRAPALIVGHSCVLSWWEAVRRAPVDPSFDRYREEVTAGLRGARMVVAPSRTMLDALDRIYGPLEGKKVIYNGRASELYVPSAKEDIVLCAGRLWDEAKNLGALARVAKKVPWPVYVAGSREHPDGGVADGGGTIPLGRLAPGELAGWLSRASIYALPARYEPFGLSVVEAGLSGCALVLGDIPSMRELWDGAAVFVDPSDSDALRKTLVDLTQRPLTRNVLANRARVRAEAFSLQRTADEYATLYRELVQEEDHPGEAPCAS